MSWHTVATAFKESTTKIHVYTKILWNLCSKSCFERQIEQKVKSQSRSFTKHSIVTLTEEVRILSVRKDKRGSSRRHGEGSQGRIYGADATCMRSGRKGVLGQVQRWQPWNYSNGAGGLGFQGLPRGRTFWVRRQKHRTNPMACWSPCPNRKNRWGTK